MIDYYDYVKVTTYFSVYQEKSYKNTMKNCAIN